MNESDRNDFVILCEGSVYLFKADGFSLNLLIHIQNRNRDRNQIFSDLTRSDFLNAFEG